MWSGGMLALILVLASGVARAAPDAAAWAFDLLARVEQWQSAGPLEFLSEATKDQPISIATQARIQKSYGRLPMHFEPNLGQTADEVKYVARGPGYTLFLTADEAVLASYLSQVGVDAMPALKDAKTEEIAAIRERNSREAIAADAVGVPTYVLNGEPFWGQDRIELLDEALTTGRMPYRPH